MLLKISEYSYKDLSAFLGIPEQILKGALYGNELSNSYKKIICDRLKIDIGCFDMGLDENELVYQELYKELYDKFVSILLEFRIRKEKIEKILDRVKFESTNLNVEILNYLCEGINPYTKENFESNHILNDTRVKMLMVNIRNKYLLNGDKNIDLNLLTSNQKNLYEKLRKWRNNKAREENYFKSYYVFTNKELLNIVLANIQTRRDLKNVKGIGKIKYEKYADEIYSIILGDKEKHEELEIISF